jgi:hypothetical protein
MPTLTVIAGPNGSGKSTLTSSIWFEGNANLIDPDAIARRLDAARPARLAIPAAREAILRCRALLAHRDSFTLEQLWLVMGQWELYGRQRMPDIRRLSSTFHWAILNSTSSAYAFDFLRADTIFQTPIFAVDIGAAWRALQKR